MKKTFDELVETYDNALNKAKSALPYVDKYPNNYIAIPIMLENQSLESLFLDVEFAKYKTLNNSVLIFEFEKQFNGWVLMQR